MVKYFESVGGEVLRVQYKGPDTGGAWVYIPDTALRSTATSGASEEEAEVFEEIVVSESAVSVFPNPTDQNNINVVVSNAIEGPVNIQMIDISGRRMFDNVFDHTEVQHGVQITPNGTLQDGMYVIMIRDGNRTRQKMLAIRQ